MKPTKLLTVSFALALASCCDCAKAASVIFNLNTIQSGATPAGTPPWATVSFTDDGPNAVLLSINSNLQNTSEFISEVNFNFDPSLNLSNLTATPVGGSGSFLYSGSPVLNLDSVSGGSGSKFDVGVNFNTGSSNPRFDSLDQSWIRLTYNGTGTFDANSFNFAETKNDEFVSAHIQGIGANSSWVTHSIPEPSAALLGGLGLIGLLRRKRH